MNIDYHKYKAEFWTLFRFVLVGGSSFLLYAALYYSFSRLLFPQANHTVENFAANVLATIFNFLAHRGWTFKAEHRSWTQMVRFLIVVLTAMPLQSFIFWIGYRLFHIHDLIMIVVATALIPLYTYCMHRTFTFRKKKTGPATVADVLDDAML